MKRLVKGARNGNGDEDKEFAEEEEGEEEEQRREISHDEKDDDEDDEDDILASKQLLQHDMTSSGSGPRLPLPDYAQRFLQTYQTEGWARETRTLMEAAVLPKLTGKRPIALKGVEQEYRKVYQLIEQTVTAGEGNSMLVFGSRGSGKSAVVDTVISSLAQQHGRDYFHVVRLNGFFQTDDRLALREMWRQLGREIEPEGEEENKSYADTMATLLALLSHPDEVLGTVSGSSVAKSVVIVLDEFDLFAARPRQTLLYNLFDIAQARKAPVAVIGLTTRVDVTEVLEKRVKSRFSHRYTFLPLPRTLDVFREICFAALDVLEGQEEEDERWKKFLQEWRLYLKVILPSFPSSSTAPVQQLTSLGTIR